MTMLLLAPRQSFYWLYSWPPWLVTMMEGTVERWRKCRFTKRFSRGDKEGAKEAMLDWSYSALAHHHKRDPGRKQVEHCRWVVRRSTNRERAPLTLKTRRWIQGKSGAECEIRWVKFAGVEEERIQSVPPCFRLVVLFLLQTRQNDEVKRESNYGEH